LNYQQSDTADAGLTMRLLFLLLCILPIPVLAQTSNVSMNPAHVRDWANRVIANDLKIRASAEAAMV